MVPFSSPAADAQRQPPTVHLVDDDTTVRTALARLLISHGYQVCTYESGEEFLARFERGAPGCLLLDVSMPGIGGVELLRQLHDAGDRSQAVFLSGRSDIPTCAQALRAGAVHFLTKPVDETALLQALDEALQHDAVCRREDLHQSLVATRLGSLTPREREVLQHVMEGRLNKQIASDLGTAEKTVKVHRARAMEKMGVRSVAELVRMVERAHLQAADAAAIGAGRHGELLGFASAVNDSVLVTARSTTSP